VGTSTEEDLLGGFYHTRKPYLSGSGSSAWGADMQERNANSAFGSGSLIMSERCNRPSLSRSLLFIGSAVSWMPRQAKWTPWVFFPLHC
jgi:hypothetical protein